MRTWRGVSHLPVSTDKELASHAGQLVLGSLGYRESEEWLGLYEMFGSKSPSKRLARRDISSASDESSLGWRGSWSCYSGASALATRTRMPHYSVQPESCAQGLGYADTYVGRSFLRVGLKQVTWKQVTE